MNSIKDIYSSFCSKIEELSEFHRTTKIAYQITKDLLSDFNDGDLNKIRKGFIQDYKHNELSYCIADRNIDDIYVVCEWVSLEEYAKRLNIDFSTICNMVENNELGNVIVDNDKKYVIWPQEQQGKSLDELPELGKKMFNVVCSQKVYSKAVIDEPTVKMSLALTEKTSDSMKKFIEIATCSLNEQCFLSAWSYFEIFVKDTLYALISINPERIFENKKFTSTSFTIKNIFEKSDSFRNLDDLKKYIIEEIIADNEKGHQSIHSIINLIKDCYLKGDMPYDTWYVYNNARIDVNYLTLMELKDIRNLIIHDGGVINDTYNYTLRTDENKRILIDDEVYEKYLFTLRSIAYNINHLITKKYMSN